MAHKLNYSQATMQAKLAAITTAVGNAGVLEIRDGTQPAGPDTTAVGTLLASFTLGSPFASTASAAIPSVLSPTLPSNVNAALEMSPGTKTIFPLNSFMPSTDILLSSRFTAAPNTVQAHGLAGEIQIPAPRPLRRLLAPIPDLRLTLSHRLGLSE